jgi:hypothetical protein
MTREDSITYPVFPGRPDTEFRKHSDSVSKRHIPSRKIVFAVGWTLLASSLIAALVINNRNSQSASNYERDLWKQINYPGDIIAISKHDNKIFKAEYLVAGSNGCVELTLHELVINEPVKPNYFKTKASYHKKCGVIPGN